VNINGSPYEQDKDDVRLGLVRRRAAEAGATIAYVNMVGGQDELVFDGDSMVVAADGKVLARAPQFAEEMLLVDVDVPPASTEPMPRKRRGEMGVSRTVVKGDLAPRRGRRRSADPR